MMSQSPGSSESAMSSPVKNSSGTGAQSGGVGGSALEGYDGQVHGGDSPPSPGQPDRVGTFTGANIQCRTGGEALGLGDQVRVGIATPQRSMGAVTVIPERLVELLGHGARSPWLRIGVAPQAEVNQTATLEHPGLRVQWNGIVPGAARAGIPGDSRALVWIGGGMVC